MKTANCKSCSQTMTGNYCSYCGEKKINEEDFSIKKIISQALGAFTNVDSKLFKSLKLLLLYPGKLTVNYIEGNRIHYMKPFQLFIITNIIFFFFLSEIDIFRTPSRWFFIEDFDGVRVLDKAKQISITKNIEMSQVKLIYDQKSTNFSKILIFVLIPFIAFIIQLVSFRKKMHFGKHLVFATHFFSFFLLLCVLIGQLLINSNINSNKWFFIIPITFALILYLGFALKNYLNESILLSISKSLIAVILFFIVVSIYRNFINLISLYTL